MPSNQDKNADQEKSKPKGGLLNGDEKVGLERLIECMHCCMWSNMKKKKLEMNAVPQSLIKDLEKTAQEKKEFFETE